MKKCPHCGASLADEAKFCLYCMKELQDKKDLKVKKHVPRTAYAFVFAALITAVCIAAAAVIVPQLGRTPAPIPDTEALTEAERTETERAETTDDPAKTDIETAGSALATGSTAAVLTTQYETEEPGTVHEHVFVYWLTLTEPTCTLSGTDIYICYICNEKQQRETPPKGHTEVTDKGYAPTCTKEGLTDGSHCGVCGVTLKERTAVAPKGHKLEITLPAAEPTCTKTGLTEEKRCTVCGTTVSQQKTVPVLGHDFSSGRCTRCGILKVTPETKLGDIGQIGDVCAFGKYEQDNFTSNGKEYIEWYVTAKTDGKVLLLSKYGLDCKAFNPLVTQGGAKWENSSIREWLNTDFADTAFSTEERKLVTASGEVILLSRDEFYSYCYDKKDLYACYPTAYAMTCESLEVNYKMSDWMLRSTYSNFVYAVQYNRLIREVYTTLKCCAIRPAIWLELEP